MKKVYSVFFIVALLFFFANSIFPQSPVGKWVDSRQNVTLILKADFTYSLTYPNGRSQGYWSSGGSQFCLRDASQANPVCYTVVAYSAASLDLRDMNGVMLNYRKVTGQNPAPPVQSAAGKKKRVKGANRVIAVQGDYKLTYGNLRTGIDLTHFIIGHKVKDSEIRELKAKLEEEFKAQPAMVLKEINGIASAMKKVYNSTDPLKIGLVRQELFAAFYKATRHLEGAQVPLMIQVIHRYIKVLAQDERNNLILTNRDVEGYISYLAFNSELAGQKLDVNYAVRREFTAQLVRNFPTMPLEQKRMVASASLMWQLLDANWKGMTPAQKNQYIQAYRNQVSRNFTRKPQDFGSLYKPPRGAHKKSLSQMRSEFNAKQNMFRMMQNMNTNTHALSLNIIENTGGTGNYWNVVDY